MKIKLPKPRGSYHDYVRSVYSDLQFLEMIKSVKRSIVKFGTDNPGKIFVGTEQATPDKIKNRIHDIMGEFELDWDTIVEFLEYPDNPMTNRSGLLAYYDKQTGTIKVQFDPTIKQDDFNGFWNIIKELQKEAKIIEKSRSKANPELSYAIYRERKRGTKFVDIATMIGDESLRNFLGYSDIDDKFFSYHDVQEIYKNYKDSVDKGRP